MDLKYDNTNLEIERSGKFVITMSMSSYCHFYRFTIVSLIRRLFWYYQMLR
jgi:hypothetical protein